MMKITMKVNVYVFVFTIMFLSVIILYSIIHSQNLTSIFLLLIGLILLFEIYKKYDNDDYIEMKIIKAITLATLVVNIIYIRDVKKIVEFLYNIGIVMIPLVYIYLVIRSVRITQVGWNLLISFELVPIKLEKYLNNKLNYSLVIKSVKNKKEPTVHKDENTGEESVQSEDSQQSTIHSEA